MEVEMIEMEAQLLAGSLPIWGTDDGFIEETDFCPIVVIFDK